MISSLNWWETIIRSFERELQYLPALSSHSRAASFCVIANIGPPSGFASAPFDVSFQNVKCPAHMNLRLDTKDQFFKSILGLEIARDDLNVNESLNFAVTILCLDAAVSANDVGWKAQCEQISPYSLERSLCCCHFLHHP